MNDNDWKVLGFGLALFLVIILIAVLAIIFAPDTLPEDIDLSGLI